MNRSLTPRFSEVRVSVKGAAFTLAWGSAPGFRTIPKRQR